MNDTNNMTDAAGGAHETTALILRGSGYELAIAPEAEARKQELMELSGKIGCVNDNEESERAQYAVRSLAGMRNLVEKSRKEVKEPVLRIGKAIDAAAKDFLNDIDAEEKRIRKMVGDHAERVANERARKEAEERRAFEEARRAREEAEAAAAKAKESKTMANVVAALQAEREREAALAARMDASAEVAAEKVAGGVSFQLDFEVADMDALMARRDLVEITPRRAAILAELRNSYEAAPNYWKSLGLRVFKKPVVASR